MNGKYLQHFFLIFLQYFQCRKQQIPVRLHFLFGHEEQLTGAKKWDVLVKKYYEATEISAELVDAMIESMQMNADSSLSIQFKHMDAFKAVLDTIETLRKEVA